MSTKFVYSAAAGLNDGSSWANAWTSLASSNGVAAGDAVKVEYRHSETGLAANINWSNGTAANPVLVISCDKDNSDAYRLGATIEWTATGIGPQGNIFSAGCTWKTTTGTLTLTPSTDGQQNYKDSTFVCTGAGGVSMGGGVTSRNPVNYLWNCNVDLSGASSSAVLLGNWPRYWIGGTLTCRGAGQTNLFNGGPVEARGVLFSGTVTSLFSASAAGNAGLLRPKFIGCVAPTYTFVANFDPGTQVDLSGFLPAGTLSAAALPPALYQTYYGTVGASLSRYRTGGADDGTQVNAYSWEVISNGNALQQVGSLVSLPITRWVAAGASQTITIYVASGGTLNNDEFWVEVLSPSEAGSPTALSKYQTTQLALLGTPAALTTDGTSTWNGTGVGTKQKVSVTISPAIPGMVSVRVYLAKPSTTVYVDPVLDVASDVNGKSRFVEGVQTFSATSGGTAGMLYRTGGG